MRPLHFILAALLLATGCSQLAIVHHNAAGPGLPELIPVGDTVPLPIHKMDIDVQVIGNRSVITYDIQFYNQKNTDLEATLDFPLGEGQHISRYALEINNNLREGVIVEKEKARVAFENTVRRKIDPGIVEQTRGNSFRTRIYPIPAKGYKRVVIAVEGVLPLHQNELHFSLPLHGPDTIENFSIKAHVARPANEPDMRPNGLDGFSFGEDKDGYHGALRKNGFQRNATLAFNIPVDPETNRSVYTYRNGSDGYFYATLAAPPSREKATYKKLVLLWDISGSAHHTSREWNFIERYTATTGVEELVLVPFAIQAGNPETFRLPADIALLRDRLNAFGYDGGTQLGSIDLKNYSADAFLLSSDGLSTFGKENLITSDKPLHCVTDAATADHAYLKHLARTTGGHFINLQQTDPGRAVQHASFEPLRLLEVKGSDAAVTDMSYEINNGIVTVAGKYARPGTIDLLFGTGGKTIQEVSFDLHDSGADSLVKRFWALLRIENLDGQYYKNKEVITALGKEFTVVTRNTSLIVLDNVDDYVQHEILPPPELRKEYATLMEHKRSLKRSKEESMEEAVAAMQELKYWYDPSLKPKEDRVVKFTPPAPTALVAADTIVVTDNFASAINDEAVVHQINVAGTADMMLTYSAGEMKDDKKEEMESTIEIAAWKPDLEYYKVLEGSKNRLADYQRLKKEFGRQPSFYLDAARIFYESGDHAQALLILSNIAELKLEEPELLRMMAESLQNMGQKALAVETYRQLLEMRGEEPQSRRDLALACTEAGLYNEAATHLYEMILGSWDQRFAAVKKVGLSELNALIAAHPDEVDTRKIDKRFIYPMPVDVRIVIGWNANDTDIDLWVTDPKKEVCNYEQPYSAIGGKLSGDITGGYGPEEFCLRKAIVGAYAVEAKLYGDNRQNLGGPITIKAEMFTNFGRPNQKREIIHFRVTEAKEVVRIGALQFGKKA